MKVNQIYIEFELKEGKSYIENTTYKLDACWDDVNENCIHISISPPIVEYGFKLPISVLQNLAHNFQPPIIIEDDDAT